MAQRWGPFSVVIVNLVMEDVEQTVLPTFHSPPRFWKCYVGDTFTENLSGVLACSCIAFLIGDAHALTVTSEGSVGLVVMFLLCSNQLQLS